MREEEKSLNLPNTFSWQIVYLMWVTIRWLKGAKNSKIMISLISANASIK